MNSVDGSARGSLPYIATMGLLLCGVFAPAIAADPLDVKDTKAYRQIKTHLDAIPAIDTHDHLNAFAALPRVKTERGEGVNLYALWRNSYFAWIHDVTPWPESGKFADWWAEAKGDFPNARATSFYRCMLPAFRDLYGVDFDTISDAEAASLDRKIFENYQREDWIYEVVTRRANIELMFIDPNWDRLSFAKDYRFSVPVLNVSRLHRGFHPSEFPDEVDSPYRYARENNLPVATLDDYLAVIGHWLRAGKAGGGVCMKSTIAYERTLAFERVPKEVAAAIYGRPKSDLSGAEIKAFEDYIMWQITALGAKLELPFQIHTGHARIQGSNPMLLVDLIQANRDTKFILFHGGYPWVGETGAIMQRHGRHVWVDTVWLPTISYTMAKRAYQEFLEVMPSNRLMWGADFGHAEGIYGATEFTRGCLAEALAEKVERGELREADALRMGRQILRDNALELFPTLKERLWMDFQDAAAGKADSPGD